ncbi:hypothetical protein ACO0RG_001747 [Hanseniaspora osmophila]
MPDPISFIANLENSVDKAQSIAIWLCKQDETFALNTKTLEDDDKWDCEEQCINFYNSMFELLKYFVKKEYYHESFTNGDGSIQEKDTSFLSPQLQLQYAQVLRNGLLQLYQYMPGKINDISMILANIFCEEEIPRVSIDDGKKKKKKKLTIKKQYHFSELKSLCCVCLDFLIEGFKNNLTSLFPLIQTGLFRNLKKMKEKPKHFHANFSINLIKLFKSIVHNSPISKEFQTKFIKYFRDMSKFPQQFKCTAVECSYILFVNHKSLRNAALMEELFKALEVDLYFDISTNATSKMICDVLVFYLTENRITMEECLEFYCKLFTNYPSRIVKAGVFESIIQFLTINYMKDPQIFLNEKYLFMLELLVTQIFQHPNIQQRKIDSITRYINYFHQFHEILLVHVSESSKILILRSLFASNKYLKADIEHVNETLLFLDFTKQLLESLLESINIDEQFINTFKNTLLQLSKCEIFLIRIHANVVLKSFFRVYPQNLQATLQSALNSLNSTFSMISDFNFSENHGNALLIANMMSISDPTFVSNDLVLKITVFATSFLKKQNASVGTLSYYKDLLCWIMLTGLMNYKDKSFIQLQKNQLFLFWKNLLTHSITFNTEDELYKNLEIRNHALTCLLAFLKNHKALLDTELIKQVTYLLTKSTAFNNQVNIKSKTIDNSLLHNEHRILQIYAVIKDYVKKDFNSSMLILVLKNFSDPHLFLSKQSNILDEFLKTDKKKAVETAPKVTLNSLLASEDSFAFGLTSLITENSIVSLQKNSKRFIFEWKRNIYWDSKFEEDLHRPCIPVFSYDYMIQLYGSEYDGENAYLPNIIGSLVNHSMFVFSEIFPYLNSSIQLSIMENLNSFMFSKKSVPERLLAIAINSSIAINDAVKVFLTHNLSMDLSVAHLLIEMLKKIVIEGEEQLMKINADTLGMITYLLENQAQKEIIDVSFKAISEQTLPYERGFHLLNIASISKYSPKNIDISRVVDLISNLVSEKDPVVHTWALDALLLTLNKIDSDQNELFSDVVDLLYTVFFSSEYGRNSNFLSIVDYAFKFDTHLIIANIIKRLTQITPPESLSEIDEVCLHKYTTLLHTLSVDIDVNKKCILLETFQHLVTLDSNKISTEVMVQVGVKVLNNSYYAVNSCSNSSLYSSKNVFDWKTSVDAIESAELLFSSLYHCKNFANKEVEYYTFLLLSKYPHNKSLLAFIDRFVDKTWIDKVITFYDMSQERLSQGINNNFVDHLKGLNIEVSATNTESSTIWQFKCVLLKIMLRLVKEQTAADEEHMAKLLELGVSASNSKIKNMKLLGIEIVELLIHKAAQIAKTREADVISVLMSAFDEFSSVQVVNAALTCCSEFFAYYPKVGPENDLIKTLVNSLLEMQNVNQHNLKIGNYVAKTRQAKNDLQMHILSAWATLTVGENFALVENYMDGLIPLWIVSLRQNAVNRHETERDFYSEPLSDVYFKMIQAIGTVANRAKGKLDCFLKSQDLQSFLFVLYAECMEYLIRNKSNKSGRNDTLLTLKHLLQSEIACDLFFEENINNECMIVFDQILMEFDDTDLLVCEICTLLAKNYIRHFQDNRFLEKLDILYELFRIELKVIAKYIPFIEEGVAEDKSGFLQSHQFEVVKEVYTMLSQTCLMLPEEFKDDLTCCLLFTIGMIFNHASCNNYVPYVLPAVKLLTSNNGTLAHELYMCTKNSLEQNFSLQNYLSSMTVFFGNGLDHTSVETFCSRLCQFLNERNEIGDKILNTLLSSEYPMKNLIIKTLLKSLFKEAECAENVNSVIKLFLTVVGDLHSKNSFMLTLLFFNKLKKHHADIDINEYMERVASSTTDKKMLQDAISGLPKDSRHEVCEMLASA